MKNTFHANRDLKKAGIVIKTSVKIDFKTKTVIRDQKKKKVITKKIITNDKSVSQTRRYNIVSI